VRLRPGRPDLTRYSRLFDVPAADGDLAVTFLGVSSLLIDDGEHALLTDGFFSRPSLPRVGLGRIAPDAGRIDAALDRLGLDGDGRLRAVIPVHTHFDHALDSPAVAMRTGALLLGGESTANVGRGYGLAESRIRVVTPGEPVELGSFTVAFVESTHCPPDRCPGTIEEPVVPPARASAYRCGEAWSLLISHRGGRAALVQGSAGAVPGALAGARAEVAYLGVGQLGVQPEEYIRAYWTETVGAVRAREVVLTHWDDFFRPLDAPLRALPYAGDDLDVTLRILRELAAEQQVGLHLPTVWRREDPWAALR
jgi:L-ascorbate metabolism protein UlaG (beta-lactamase superfamily)